MPQAADGQFSAGQGKHPYPVKMHFPGLKITQDDFAKMIFEDDSKRAIF
jgi:hypothetical protein